MLPDAGSFPQSPTLADLAAQLCAEAEAPRSIGLCAAHAAAGTTLAAADLARRFGAAGRRVALVELNFVRPALRPLFGLAPGPGVADILLGAAAPAEAVAVVDDRLSILAAGRVVPPPVLPGPRFGLLHARLLLRFDTVVYDCAPVAPDGDTLAAAPHFDAMLLVARKDRTPRAALLAARKAVEAAGGWVGGVILNDRPAA